ncbi:MAG: hypothetical protein N2594_02175 [Clostridiales bacterium]|nr:hypothetical protein [Clostridiales bacterium]
MVLYILIFALLGANILICCHYLLNSLLKSNYSLVLPIDHNNTIDEN